MSKKIKYTQHKYFCILCYEFFTSLELAYDPPECVNCKTCGCVSEYIPDVDKYLDKFKLDNNKNKQE